MAAKTVACICYRSASPGSQLCSTIKAMNAAIEALNTSTVTSLLCIPGVGDTTARKVLEARNAVEDGRFADLKQVLDIPQCGRRIVSLLMGAEEFTKYHKLRCRAGVVDISSGFEHASDAGNGLVHGERAHAMCSPDVVSVDLGLSNAAWAHLNCNLDVIEWQKVSTAFPDPYNIEGAHAAVLQFVGQLPDVSTYVIEAQSHRTSPAGPAVSGFIKIGLQLRILEALTFNSLKLMGKRVLSFQSKVVADIFGLKSLPSRRKKLSAIGIVGSLLREEEGAATLSAYCPALEGQKLSVQEDTLEVYANEKKTDDLCDCLLQGIAFYDCLMSSYILRNTCRTSQ